MACTRFNPTISGPLHVGHLYLIRLNQALAGERGRFTVRIDDEDLCVAAALDAATQRKNLKAMLDDLEWLDISPAAITLHSEHRDQCAAELRHLGMALPVEVPGGSCPIDYAPCRRSCDVPTVVGEEKTEQFSPWNAAVRVILDRLNGIDLVVRGRELFGEYQLYQYVCQQLGYPLPRHVYVPRLMMGGEAVSKSAGTMTLGALRTAGYTPQGLEAILRRACLVKPLGPWHYSNLLSQPDLELVKGDLWRSN